VGPADKETSLIRVKAVFRPYVVFSHFASHSIKALLMFGY
jgi:hypothetical protein